MVRFCIAPNCENTDQIILSHRFPKKSEQAAKWAKVLGVDDMDLVDLTDRYVVCCLHFEASSYRNIKSNHLNITAMPTLNPTNMRLPPFKTSVKQVNPMIVTIARENQDSDEAIVSRKCASIGNDTEICQTDFAIFDFPDADNSSQQNLMENCHLVDNIFSPTELPDTQEDQTENDRIQDDNESDNNSDQITEVFMDEDTEQAATADVGIQVNVDELERGMDKPTHDKYQHMSRQELIESLKDSMQTIREQQKKIEAFQRAQVSLLSSVDAFKNLMGTL